MFLAFAFKVQCTCLNLTIYNILFQIEGEVEKDSEVRATYKDLQAKRPICQKLIDHTEEIQPKSEESDETSEYRSTINNLEVSENINTLHATAVFHDLLPVK